MARLGKYSLVVLVLFSLTACSSRTVSPTTQLPSATVEPRPPATSTPVPTNTLVPTLSPTETPAPTLAPTLMEPALAGTPFSSPAAAIAPDQVSRLVELARWGQGRITDVSWSQDGRWLEVGATIGTYVFADGALGAPRFFEGHVTDSTQGMLAASSPNGVVQVWQAADWKQLYDLPGSSPVFSPDGQVLAVLEGDGVRLVKAADGAPLARLSHQQVNTLKFSANSSMLVTSSRNSVHAWETAGGRELFNREYSQVLRVSFTSGGSFLLVQDRSQEGNMNLEVWQTGDWTRTATIESGGAYVVQPDEKQLYLYSNYPSPGQVSIFSLPDGKLVSQFRAGGSIYRMAVSPDSRVAAVSIPDPTAGRIELYTTAGKLIQRLNCGYACDAAMPQFSPDGSQVIAAGLLPAGSNRVGGATVYASATGKLVRILRAPSNTPSTLQQAEISPDGSRIVTVTSGQDAGIREWNTTDGSLVTALDWGSLSLTLGSLSPDDRRAAVYADRPVVTLLNLADGSAAETFSGSTQPIFTNNSLLLTNEIRNGKPAGWRLRGAGQNLLVFPYFVTRPLVFSPSGNLAASARDAAVRLYAVPSGHLDGSLLAIGRPDVHLQQLAFSSDGTVLAGGDSNGGVWLWGMTDRKLELILDGNSKPVSGLAFSADNAWLASLTTDGSLAIRRLADSADSMSLDLQSLVKAADSNAAGFGEAAGLAYSPDGSLMAVGGILNPLQTFPGRTAVTLLIRASDGKLLRILPGGGQTVAFTSDSRLLLTSGDGAVHIWGVNP